MCGLLFGVYMFVIARSLMYVEICLILECGEVDYDWIGLVIFECEIEIGVGR